jgi:hypothetical protein
MPNKGLIIALEAIFAAVATLLVLASVRSYGGVLAFYLTGLFLLLFAGGGLFWLRK